MRFQVWDLMYSRVANGASYVLRFAHGGEDTVSERMRRINIPQPSTYFRSFQCPGPPAPARQRSRRSVTKLGRQECWFHPKLYCSALAMVPCTGKGGLLLGAIPWNSPYHNAVIRKFLKKMFVPAG